MPSIHIKITDNQENTVTLTVRETSGYCSTVAEAYDLRACHRSSEIYAPMDLNPRPRYNYDFLVDGVGGSTFDQKTRTWTFPDGVQVRYRGGHRCETDRRSWKIVK